MMLHRSREWMKIQVHRECGRRFEVSRVEKDACRETSTDLNVTLYEFAEDGLAVLIARDE